MHKNSPYKFFTDFVYRTPLFPINTIDDAISIITKSDLSENKLFLECIYLASPQLIKELIRYQNGKLSEKDELKLHISLLKYLIRMSSRCTPFGLFAGCGTGKITDKSKIEVKPYTEHNSNTRLDMDYLCSLIKNISMIEGVKMQSMFYPNTSIYFSGKNIRYTEYQYLNYRRKYSITEIDSQVYLEKILKKAKNGITIDELSRFLSDDGFDFEEAKEYINSLIDIQLLTSELEPSVTCTDILNQLISQLLRLDNTEQIILDLKGIRTSLQQIDNKSIGRPIHLYEEIERRVKELNTKCDTKYLFQTDLIITSNVATISSDLTNKVLDALNILNQLTPSYEYPSLKKFKEDFYKRYEDEEIPLATALDVETGIGFGASNSQQCDITPFLNGLKVTKSVESKKEINVDAVKNILIDKYEEFLKNPVAKEIIIKEADLSTLPVNWNDLPDTMSAMVEVIRSENSPQGSLIFLKSIGGPSASNLLGRFCNVDKTIHKQVQRIIKKEEELNSDKILAEVVHLPEERVGNILLRPKLRKYEMPYLANTTNTDKSNIPISDLMVSVPHGRYIRLRSKQYDKEILPKLSCAHNYSNNSLPIYNFLCSLQTQQIRSGIGFNWGKLLENKPFLPRVRFQNIIISPAIWNITPDDTKHIPKITSPDFYERCKSFKEKAKLPNLVLLIQGDNKLLIDFTQKLSVQMLFTEIRNKYFKLEEYLFDQNFPLVSRNDETFTNQIILSLYKEKQQHVNKH